MTQDSSYLNLPKPQAFLDHKYGEKVRLVSTPYLMSVLARVCEGKTRQPEFNQLINILYQGLIETVVSSLFPTVKTTVHSRMEAYHPEGVFQADLIDPNLQVVTVDLARAGTGPSNLAFEFCHTILRPDNIRQDHFYVNRKVNEAGQVIGVDMSGSKIGGDVENKIVLFPDPMGATGGTISHALKHYQNTVGGKARFYVSLHLIVTPEYLTLMKKEHPDLHIFAIRLDRGLSSEKVLNSIPGTYWQEEKGLNQLQYIVPGGGGFGELMNNTLK
ncbi:MAG: uracil phosphoribosyltransferase [Bacteriovoracaceae bacterium]